MQTVGSLDSIFSAQINANSHSQGNPVVMGKVVDGRDSRETKSV